MKTNYLLKIAEGLLFEKLWLKYSPIGHMFYKRIQGVFAGIGLVNRFSLLQKLWWLKITRVGRVGKVGKVSGVEKVGKVGCVVSVG